MFPTKILSACTSSARVVLSRPGRPLELLASKWWIPTSLRTANSRTFASKSTNAGTEETSSTTPTTTSVSGKTNTKQPFLQNQEWIKFQQSIQVEGFQTGQMTKASVMLRKSKGGKQSRNRKAKELALLQQELRDSNGGAASNLASSDNRFPAIRYSPLETQELLKLAYETLPQKTGKRGSRNQKRQDQRWKDVRQIRKTYKQNIVAAHERKMEHRQWTRAQTKAVKEGAEDVCRQNVQYQATILQRWAATMYPTEPRGMSTTSPEIAAA